MTPEEAPNGRIADALARSRIYQFLSAAFFYPQADFFEAMRAPDSALLDDLRACASHLGDGLEAHVEAVWAAFRADSFEALETEYQRTFSHTITEVAPPYETQYGAAHLFQQMQTMSDLAGFYRAFGLERSAEAKERIDHIAIELEFMYALAFKEAYALEYHGEEKAGLCRQAQRTFLKAHLGRWVPVFAKQLRDKVDEDGFYAALATFTEAFVTSESKRLDVSPEPAGLPQAESLELVESCLTCPLSTAYIPPVDEGGLETLQERM